MVWRGKQGYSNYEQNWKRLVIVLMIVFGFITYSLEALNFVNDPINVVHQKYKPYFLVARDLYVGICAVMIAYLVYCLIQIGLNYPDITFRNRIFFLFSLYFIFTINLCTLKSHDNRQHIHLLPKRRTSTFGHHHQ